MEPSVTTRCARDAANGPLRKVTVGLIKTYKQINEVRMIE